MAALIFSSQQSQSSVLDLPSDILVFYGFGIGLRTFRFVVFFFGGVGVGSQYAGIDKHLLQAVVLIEIYITYLDKP